jgi:hypothetical protein
MKTFTQCKRCKVEVIQCPKQLGLCGFGNPYCGNDDCISNSGCDMECAESWYELCDKCCKDYHLLDEQIYFDFMDNILHPKREDK